MINEIQNKITHLLNEIKEEKNLKENKNKLISSWKSLEKPDPPSESDVLLFSKKNYENTNQTVFFLLIHFLERKGIDLKGFYDEISKNCYVEGYMNEVEEYGNMNEDIALPYNQPSYSHPPSTHSSIPSTSFPFPPFKPTFMLHQKLHK